MDRLGHANRIWRGSLQAPPSAPHAARPGADVDPRALARTAGCGAGRHHGPVRSLEQAEQLFGNEAGPRRVDGPIALRMLPVGEEALRHHEMKVVLGSRHRDVEQATFLLELGRGAGTQVGRHAAVDHVEHVDRLPLLAKLIGINLARY
jgi:hypothetical protein